MKTQSALCALLLGVSFLAVPYAEAATLYWDANGIGRVGSGATPTATWGSSVFWTTDVSGVNIGSPVITANTTNADDLFFVAGPGAQVANSLNFRAQGATIISGGTSITIGDGNAENGGNTLVF